ATSIAETSLTIEGVRIVVDSGMARVQRDEPDIGLTRLETVRASRAAVDQRRGRAGRIEAGVCYRLWDEPQTVALAAYTQPEILSADLSSLVLDLAQWGVSDPAELAFLDSPPLPLAARQQRARSRPALGLAGRCNRKRGKCSFSLPARGSGTDQRRNACISLSRSRRSQPGRWQFFACQWARRGRGPGIGAGARALYRGRRTHRHRSTRAYPAGGADHARRDRAIFRRSYRDRRRDLVRSWRDGVAGAPQEKIACNYAFGSAAGAGAIGRDRAGAGGWTDRRWS